MHGRSRETIDARILTMPGRSISGFHRPGRHRFCQERSAVRCRASRMMKGELVRKVSCILPRTACEAHFFALYASFNEGEGRWGGGLVESCNGKGDSY